MKITFTVTNPAMKPPCKAPSLRQVRAPAAEGGAVLPPKESAGLFTKFGRLRRELTVWVKKGAPLAPTEVRRERLAICAACQYYSATGNLGLGECQYPGCSCTRIKAALATSKCPQKPPLWAQWSPK